MEEEEEDFQGEDMREEKEEVREDMGSLQWFLVLYQGQEEAHSGF